MPLMPKMTSHRLKSAACLLALSMAMSTAVHAADGADPRESSAGLQIGAQWTPPAPNDASAGAMPVDEATVKNRQQVEAGIRFENGEGVTQDYSRARSLYCNAAREDDPDALIRLGWLYANGRGVTRNDQIAATLFLRAANLGSDMATQLTLLFRSTSTQMPACLGGNEVDDQRVDAPRRLGGGAMANAAGASSTATPVVADPAPFRTAPPAVERRKVVELVVQLARQFKLDPRLVLALIGTESGFDPNARSNKNAQGLMQLIPDTAERFAVKDMFDPLENLRGGMSYLRWLLAYYRGDVMLAVAAYNAGEGAVDKFKGVPPFAETLAYVQRIRAFYPFDFHPFDSAATGPSAILRIGREPAASQAPSRTPRS